MGIYFVVYPHVHEEVAMREIISNGEKRYHDLSDLAGSWSEEEAAALEKPQEIFGEIDEQLWEEDDK